MISGSEDAANNFGRGYYTLGRELCYTVEEKLNKLLDSSPSLAGFILFHSFGGGTGSGLTSLVMEYISDEHPKKSKIEFIIYPSPKVRTYLRTYYSILNTFLEKNCIITNLIC